MAPCLREGAVRPISPPARRSGRIGRWRRAARCRPIECAGPLPHRSHARAPVRARARPSRQRSRRSRAAPARRGIGPLNGLARRMTGRFAAQRAVHFGGKGARAHRAATSRLSRYSTRWPWRPADTRPACCSTEEMARHRGRAHAEALGEVGGRERGLAEKARICRRGTEASAAKTRCGALTLMLIVWHFLARYG